MQLLSGKKPPPLSVVFELGFRSAVFVCPQRSGREIKRHHCDARPCNTPLAHLCSSLPFSSFYPGTAARAIHSKRCLRNSVANFYASSFPSFFFLQFYSSCTICLFKSCLCHTTKSVVIFSPTVDVVKYILFWIQKEGDFFANYLHILFPFSYTSI